MFCTNCGAFMDDDLNFCTNCGAPLKKNPTPAEPDPLDAIGSSPIGSAPIDDDPFLAPEPIYEPVQQPTQVQPRVQETYVPPVQPAPVATASAPAKRSNAPVIALAVVALIAVAVGVFVFFGGKLPFLSGGEDSGESTEQVEPAETEEAETEEEPEPATESEPEPEPETNSATAVTSWPAPSFTDATASSELPGDEITAYYGARNVLDGDFHTAWNEGANGHGEGEWVQIQASTEQHVTGIRICAGYSKAADVYDWNNRPRDVTISFSDGSSVDVTLDDAYSTWQVFELSRPVDTTYVRITVNSVYPGSQWDDTAISDIQVY